MSEFVLTSDDITPVRPRFDGWGVAARKKLGVGPEWEWYNIEALEPFGQGCDTLIEGGVPNLGTSAKYKWRGVKSQRCVITHAEFEATCQEYERETGKCHACAGSGETLKQWSASTGATYQTCKRCAGSGLTPNGVT